jgi:Spy/CpxP family protein refolding chaperone
MEPTTKNRVLYITLAVLVLLNIISIGSMWMLRGRDKVHPPFFPGGPRMQPPHGMQQHPGMHPFRDGKMFLAEELKFTPEQNEKFVKLRDEHFTSSRKLIDEMHKSMDDMMELLKTKDGDAKAEEYAAKTSAIQKDLQLSAYRHFKSVRDICDDKQKERFDSIIKDVTKMMAPQGPLSPGK